ncbi:putative ubiquitin-conjugating enzyme E2 38 [Ipomoea triloba]|uniref:putative ubiquitin-conjugating enzyme E2 38 n=1 Tax=Ipomoea triloba TaxID=35885 RepID=UPI00125E5514|nr:putative ubiquitin-conjugating enzyme E2 38 [Ipomoea triloba]
MEMVERERLALQHPDDSAVDKSMHNEDVEGSASVPASANESLDNNNKNGSNSSCIEDANDGVCEDLLRNDDVVCESEYSDEEGDYAFAYDNDDDNDDDDSDYLRMQAQFDSVDLPAGVEASVPWLNEPTPSSTVATSVSAPQDCSSGQPAGVGTSANFISQPVGTNIESSGSSAGQTSSGKCDDQNGDGNEVIRKYQHFKHFDLVDDSSDHHYYNMDVKGQRPKAWLKKIQDDWKILESDLPDSIYVRVYEKRMDLLRAVIVGPQGTPYHDGLFVFDAFFPDAYPDKPPMLYYYSGGLRLNPNLYDSGKVCLSLLNTWTGQATEIWQPKQSTMLQILVSIQALILNAKPFFNEPGYESSYVGVKGEQKSKEYNEDAVVLSLKTMMYTLRRPPRNFEDLVIGHFQTHAHDILSACKAYMEGAAVGSVVKGEIQGNDGSGGSAKLKEDVSKMMNGLISNFTKKGAKDCEKFRLAS